jgi:hypothetical protein
VERMQAEIDRMRDAVHDLRSRIVVLEVTVTSNADMLHRMEGKVDTLARKDEIEDAVKSATQETKYRFWHTWQGIVTTSYSPWRSSTCGTGSSDVTVAALYVDPEGVYAGIPDVEVWDEERDARTYAGPWPVVAHPPCNRWVSYGAREVRGDDAGCFAAALRAVREYGGVLEHPAASQAWRAFGLPQPERGFWTAELFAPGWTTETDQSWYGFPTRKPTWLYYVGPEPPAVVAHGPLNARGCETLWSTERSRTPAPFRDALLEAARASAVPRLTRPAPRP